MSCVLLKKTVQKDLAIFSLSRYLCFFFILFLSTQSHPSGFEDDVNFEGAALRGEIVGLGIVVVDKAYKNIITSMSPEQKALFQISFYLNFGFVFVLNRFAYSARPGFLIEVL